MIYQIFQAHSDLMRPARVMAKLASGFLGQSGQDSAPNYLMRSLAASSELFSRADMTFERPAYGIDTISRPGGTPGWLWNLRLESTGPHLTAP